MSWQEKAKGAKAIHSIVVEPDLTAHHFGNEGIHVLATAMVGLLAEQTLNKALMPMIPTGSAIVGVRQQTYHRAPAPIGTKVHVTITITKVNKKIVFYQFQIETNDGVRLADGDGDSAIVDMERFMS